MLPAPRHSAETARTKLLAPLVQGKQTINDYVIDAFRRLGVVHVLTMSARTDDRFQQFRRGCAGHRYTGRRSLISPGGSAADRDSSMRSPPAAAVTIATVAALPAAAATAAALVTVATSRVALARRCT